MKSIIICTLLLLLLSLVGNAQQTGDVLSHSTVTVKLSGAWTAASIADARFTASVSKDVSSSIALYRSAAWLSDAAAIDPADGTAILLLDAWGDAGTFVDRLLSASNWTATKAYFADVIGVPPSDPFVAIATRTTIVELLFTGNGWHNTTALPEEELHTHLTADVDAVEDVTALTGHLTGEISTDITRTNTSATVQTIVTTAGIQNVTRLLMQSDVFATTLTYYTTQTALNDGAFTHATETAVPFASQQLRVEVTVQYSGSWQLVLQSHPTDVMDALQTAYAAALHLTAPRLVMRGVSAPVYPFNLRVVLYVVYARGFDAAAIPTAVASANLTALERLYASGGGDPAVVPVFMRAGLVDTARPTREAAQPLSAAFDLRITGTAWAAVWRRAPAEYVRRALTNDLTAALPYTLTEVRLPRQSVHRDGSLQLGVTVTQRNAMQLDPVAVSAFLEAAKSLRETQAVYDQYAGEGGLTQRAGYSALGVPLEVMEGVTASSPGSVTIQVETASPSQGSHGLYCSSRCIGVSVMGGVILLLCIIALFLFAIWRTFGRFVSPKKDDTDLVRIPAYQNPFTPVMANSVMSNSFYSAKKGAGEGPMFPPNMANVAPFGPRAPIAYTGSPEARMTSFVASRPSSSVLRQSHIVIPSSSGEKEFEIVVVPREQYEQMNYPRDATS